MALVGCWVCLMSAKVEASIHVPDNQMPYIDVLAIDQLLLEASQRSNITAEGIPSDARLSTSAAPLRRPPQEHFPCDPEKLFLEVLFSPGQTLARGSTSGTSTSSNGNITGPSSIPIDANPTVIINHSDLTCWFHGERRFSWPMPPGVTLLRPPQACLTQWGAPHHCESSGFPQYL